MKYNSYINKINQTKGVLNMKKWLIAMVAIVMVVLAGCGAKDDSSKDGGSNDDSTISKVEKDKKLIIGTNAGYYPFEMIDKDGKMVGYDIDVATALAKSMGATVEVKQFGFDALIPALQTGKIDMIFAGMTITKERENAVSFADAYYETGQGVMVRNDSKIKDLKEVDEKGKTVVVQIGTTGSIVAKKELKNAEIKEYEDFPSAALAVQQGQADALVYDEPAIKVYALQNEGKVKALDGLLATDKLGIAIKKGDEKTVKYVNDFLKEYLGSKEEEETKKKWFEDSNWLNQVESPKQ